MVLPVTSRKAAIMASLTKQKPVSSTAVIVPVKARLNKESFTITDLPISFVLNEGKPGCNKVPPKDGAQF
jgi:hypothetical protein